MKTLFAVLFTVWLLAMHPKLNDGERAPMKAWAWAWAGWMIVLFALLGATLYTFYLSS